MEEHADVRVLGQIREELKTQQDLFLAVDYVDAGTRIGICQIAQLDHRRVGGASIEGRLSGPHGRGPRFLARCGLLLCLGVRGPLRPI